MIGPRVVISAVLSTAALAGCLAYLLRPPIASVKIDMQSDPGKPQFGGPVATVSKGAETRPVENEKVASDYLAAAHAILRQAPAAHASAGADEVPITGRIPLPRKRPIPRDLGKK